MDARLLKRDSGIPTRRSLLYRLRDWEDARSWGEFYELYSPLIYGVAMRAGLTEAEAEDVVQETVAAVCQRIRAFEYDPDRCRFKTWLHAITKRQVAKQYARREGRGRRVDVVRVGDEAAAVVDNLPDPAGRVLDELWDREYELNLIEAAKKLLRRRLRPKPFRIYDYHVLQGHSVRETARDLEVTEAQVYLAKSRVGAELGAEIARLRSMLI